jgi:hypothetical protein
MSAYPYLIIDDDNYRDFTASMVQRTTGYRGFQNPDSPHEFRAGRPVGPTIPRNEWTERVKDGQGSFLSDIVKAQGIKSKDQGSLGYCWVYGSTRAVEVQRAIQGFTFLDLSPESVGGPVVGWRNRGGYASEAFDQLQEFGACESSYMDAPHSLSPKRWKAGWQQNALQYRATQWYEIGTSFDEVYTMLLNRIPVAAGLDWWGHLVCFLDPVVLPDGSFGVLFQNSWGVDWPTAGAHGFSVLTESKATPDGAGAPIMVSPDVE